MSHIKTIDDARYICQYAGQCEEYHAIVRQEEAIIDKYTKDDIVTTVGFVVVLVVIGLSLVLASRNNVFRRFYVFLLPKLIVALPVLFGLLFGFFIGFAINFSACFKQTCSPFEESAFVSIPMLSLFISVPLASLVYRVRGKIKNIFA